MANYHLNAMMITRTSGNTVNGFAYRSGVQLTCERTGEVFDWRHKDVCEVKVFLPDTAPKWATDIQELCKMDREKAMQMISDLAEYAEKRCDAQVYREMDISLPRELTLEQNIKLANEFTQKYVCSLGMFATNNFHMDEAHNPHFHVVMLMREMTKDGLNLKKNLLWNHRDIVKNWREQWADFQNEHLHFHGHDVRVDHRSYKARNIELEPEVKLGANVRAWEEKEGGFTKNKAAFVTERGCEFKETKLRNMYRLLSKPEIVFDVVTSKQSTFQIGDLEKEVFRHVDDVQTFQNIMAKLMISSELVQIRETDKTQEESETVYTTRKMLKQETSFLQTVCHKLVYKKNHFVSSHIVKKTIASLNEALKSFGGLSQDQERALHHVLNPDQISCVIGYAGAGKTTIFKAAADAWKNQGYNVVGLAPTGRAAENLEEEGIASQTLHKFLYHARQGRNQLKKNTVLVLDEAGMVDIRFFNELVQLTQRLGVKLVVTGDQAQLASVEAGSALRILKESIPFVTLSHVVRQKEDWQREASKNFGDGRVLQALEAYQEHGHIHFVKEEDIDTTRPDGMVENYALLYRQSTSLYFEIKKEKEGGMIQNLWDHPDWGRFQDLKKTRANIATTLRQNLDTFRPFMKERGIDGISFARHFVDPHSSYKNQCLEALDLARKWDIPIQQEKRVGEKSHVCDTNRVTRDQMIKAWSASRDKHAGHAHLLLAHTKQEVERLNESAREILKETGLLKGPAFTYEVMVRTDLENLKDTDKASKVVYEKMQRSFQVEDQIVFTKNNNSLKVKNGMIGTLISLDKNKVCVALGEGSEKREVSFAPQLFKHFDQGWATNIHKSQGQTIDRTFVLGGQYMSRNLSYVALTRHKISTQLFCSDQDFLYQERALRRLSQEQEKLAVSDYINLEKVDDLLKKHPNIVQRTHNRVENHLFAARIMGKKVWEGFATHFLSATPLERQIFLPQTSQREEERARYVLRKTLEADSGMLLESVKIKPNKPEELQSHEETQAQAESLSQDPLFSRKNTEENIRTSDELRDGPITTPLQKENTLEQTPQTSGDIEDSTAPKQDPKKHALTEENKAQIAQLEEEIRRKELTLRNLDDQLKTAEDQKYASSDTLSKIKDSSSKTALHKMMNKKKLEEAEREHLFKQEKYLTTLQKYEEEEKQIRNLKNRVSSFYDDIREKNNLLLKQEREKNQTHTQTKEQDSPSYGYER